MRKKFFLFDLDGVLTETKQIHFKAFAMALEKFGIFLSEDEHKKLYDGLPTSKKLELISKNYNLTQAQMIQIDDLKQSKTIDLLKSEIVNCEDLKKLFEKIKTEGIRSCVCSNARKSTILLTLNQLGISEFFEFTLSQEDVSEAKPSPAIYLAAQQKFKASTEECLIFEDSPHGVEAARLSGIEFRIIPDSKSLTAIVEKELL